MNQRPKKLTKEELSDVYAVLARLYSVETARELKGHIAALQAENEELKRWIRSEGERTDTCTYNILKEICNGCRCHRMPKEPNEKH